MFYMIGRRINYSLLTRFMRTYAFFFFAANAVVLFRVLVITGKYQKINR